MAFELLFLCKLFSRSVDLGRRVLGEGGNPLACGFGRGPSSTAMGKILGRRGSLNSGAWIPS